MTRDERAFDTRGMARWTDKNLVRYASLEGRVKAARAVTLRAYGDGREAASREQWPELWDALDGLFDMVKVDRQLG